MENCPSEGADAGRAPVCSGCPSQGLCSSAVGGSVAVPKDDEVLRVRLGAIKHKILVLSGKGGVGKSSVAVGLAGYLAKSGKRVGLLDADLCGPSTALMLGVGGEQHKLVTSPQGWLPIKPEGFEGRLSLISSAMLLPNSSEALVWRGPRKHGLLLQMLRDVFWSRLDYLIVDTPPGTSDEHLTVVSALGAACSGAILVSSPAEMSLHTVRRMTDFCRRVRVPLLGVVENMSGYQCPCCGAFEDVWGQPERLQTAVAAFAKLNNAQCTVLGRIPIDPNMSEAADAGRLPLEGPAAESLRALAEKIVEITTAQEEGL